MFQEGKEVVAEVQTEFHLLIRVHKQHQQEKQTLAAVEVVERVVTQAQAAAPA